MTESELEIVRLKLRLEIHQILLRGLYSGLANSSADGSQAYRDRFAARKEHGKIAIPGLPRYIAPWASLVIQCNRGMADEGQIISSYGLRAATVLGNCCF